jgi:hypothetical protein
MVDISTTHPSSAEIIPFAASPPASQPQSNGKLTFMQARDAWLAAALADQRLTAGEARLCGALSLHFNFGHYATTGELIAWPGWETLMAASTLSKMTVYRSLENLERLGVLDIERGRYDRGAKRRAGNTYRACRYQGITDVTLVRNLPNKVSRPRYQNYQSKVTHALQDSSSLGLDDLRKKAGPPEGASAYGLGPKQEDLNSEQPSSIGSLGYFGSPGSAWQPSTAPQAPASSSAPPPGSARPPSPRHDRWRQERADDEAVLERYRLAAGGGQ